MPISPEVGGRSGISGQGLIWDRWDLGPLSDYEAGPGPRGLGPSLGRRSDSKNAEVWACLRWQRSQVWTGQKGMTARVIST